MQGTGTINDPWLVSSVADFKKVGKSTTGEGAYNYVGGYFKQVADLDFTGETSINVGSYGSIYIKQYYDGNGRTWKNFNGNNFAFSLEEASNISIENFKTTTGSLINCKRINNINIINTELTNSNLVTQSNYIDGMILENITSIGTAVLVSGIEVHRIQFINCSMRSSYSPSGPIAAKIIDECSYTGEIYGTYVSGIAQGWEDVTITRCKVDAKIVAEAYGTGLIVNRTTGAGSSSGPTYYKGLNIEACSVNFREGSTGTHLAGIAYVNGGSTIKDCHVTGFMDANYVYGIALTDNLTGGSILIERCICEADIKAVVEAGGIIDKTYQFQEKFIKIKDCYAYSPRIVRKNGLSPKFGRLVANWQTQVPENIIDCVALESMKFYESYTE